MLKGGIDGESDGERIRREFVQRVRDEVGAVASLRQVDIVAALPKTRSGKILRKTMREIADGKTRRCRGRSRTPRFSTPRTRAAPRRLTCRTAATGADGIHPAPGIR